MTNRKDGWQPDRRLFNRIIMKKEDKPITVTRALRDGAVVFKDVDTYQRHIERVLNMVLTSRGIPQKYMSQKAAFKEYGRGVVESWIKFGLVKRIKDGEKNCKVRLSMTELEAAALTSNRCEWYDMNAKKTVNQ